MKKPQFYQGPDHRQFEWTPLFSTINGGTKYVDLENINRESINVTKISKKSKNLPTNFVFVCLFLFITGLFFVLAFYYQQKEQLDNLGNIWITIDKPFSVLNPNDLGFNDANRPKQSQPGPIFETIIKDNYVPLPTNSWCENFFLGDITNGENNRVFQLPYIIDTGGPINGIRTHPAHVQANDRSVMMVYEAENGLTLSGTEDFLIQHTVAKEIPSIGRLSIVLQWETEDRKLTGKGSAMRSPIVRGSPYTTMEYINSSPRIVSERSIKYYPIIDGTDILTCGTGNSHLIKNELRVQFEKSDMTWLIFVSEPTEFICTNTTVIEAVNNLPPGVLPPKSEFKTLGFDLKAVKPMRKGVVRIALSNNCTTGENAQFCDTIFKSRDQSEYTSLLRQYSAIYPTGHSDITFTFPTETKIEEEIRLNFDWAQVNVHDFANTEPFDTFTYPEQVLMRQEELTISRPDVLMYGIPHHQERLATTHETPIIKIHDFGCVPTIHGKACPISANSWSQIEHLHQISFYANKEPREEMKNDLLSAIKEDINFRIPTNYMKGAGDTYFSGKILAKLARIILLADQFNAVTSEEFQNALTHLQQGVEIWLNGTAQSAFLYDNPKSGGYGGIVMCGCNYNGETQSCSNAYPDCPALVDVGSNFGGGFYNDHHYHYGYHIYAAAVVSKFNHKWLDEYYEHVLLLIRDIANPSENDPYFPTWRHKDWYLGFSWASGIVTLSGLPYPNGRNQESSSEAISAYEAVSLFGATAAERYDDSAVNTIFYDRYQTSRRIKDLGRLLCATELRSAKTYWHVQSAHAVNVSRIYPNVYTPKVVGMLWSMLAQEQTWFGNEPYKSYGIQLLPITVVSELRDTIGWVEEMLPLFSQSCDSDENCPKQGWSILVNMCQATVGEWQYAWKSILELSPEVYESAGGNGHSKSNSLWFISTR